MPRIRRATTAGVRKLSRRNRASVSPIRSLLRGMIAVCGMGRPSGWRNRAVTANQSARPPTIAASAKACTKPMAGCKCTVLRAAMNNAAIASNMPVASSRIRRAGLGWLSPMDRGTRSSFMAPQRLRRRFVQAKRSFGKGTARVIPPVARAPASPCRRPACRSAAPGPGAARPSFRSQGRSPASARWTGSARRSR